MRTISRAVVIGSGRMALGLIPALRAANTLPVAHYSRSEEAGRKWRAAWGTEVVGVERLADVPSDVDAYLLAVADDALETVAQDLPADVLRVHFAGAGPKELPGGPAAVVWPIQTFADAGEPDWGKIHVAVSAEEDAAAAWALVWAAHFAASVTRVSFENRIRAHAAAVFAANYTNRMFTHAQQLASEAGLPWEAYQPLIQSIFAAAASGQSAAHQTGPAHRGDRTTLARHQALLSHRPGLAALYAACAADLLPPDPHASTR
jgi:predicted short-subunit dehydrogenase-like oxidoreductase (DUF2520 family)